MAYYEKSPSNLSRTITVRCTRTQHKTWTENARMCGLSLNSYVRIACTYLATKETNAGVARFYNLASQEIESDTDTESD